MIFNQYIRAPVNYKNRDTRQLLFYIQEHV